MSTTMAIEKKNDQRNRGVALVQAQYFGTATSYKL